MYTDWRGRSETSPHGFGCLPLFLRLVDNLPAFSVKYDVRIEPILGTCRKRRGAWFVVCFVVLNSCSFGNFTGSVDSFLRLFRRWWLRRIS